MKGRVTAGVAVLIFACALPVLCQQPGGADVHRLSLPDKNWSLDIALSEFSVFYEEISDEAGGYSLGAMRRKGERRSPSLGALQVRIETARVEGRSAGLPELIANRLKAIKKAGGKGVKTSEYNHIPVVSYSGESSIPMPMMVSSTVVLPPPSAAFRFPHQDIEAYLVKDDYWIVISLFAPSIKGDDEKLFYAILDSARLVDTSSPASSFDYYQKGRSLFLAKSYRKALAPLSTALGLERQNRLLDVARWRNLVEMLTDSYSLTGDMPKAKEVLDYGVGSDPTHPVFHRALARLYASAGDLDNTIASLSKAFMYEKNRAPAPRTPDQLFDLTPPQPDPMSDPAFARFKNDERFRKAVKEMKK